MVDVDVLGAFGVDGRGDDLDSAQREVRGDEAPHGEDRGVIAVQEGPQEGPDLGVGFGGVDVAAPDPTGVPAAVQFGQREGLGVVDDDDVVAVVVERVGVARRLGEVPLLLLGGETVGEPCSPL